LYAKVALPLPFNPIYTYAVPERLAEGVRPGTRVLVPLGRRLQTGYVLELAASPDFDSERIKPVNDVLDPFPLLTGELLDFCARLADYYVASIGETLRAALPPGINLAGQTCFRLSGEETPVDAKLSPLRKRLLRLLAEHPDVGLRWLKQQLRRKSLYHDLHYLLERGLIVAEERIGKGRLSPRREPWLRLPPAQSRAELEEAIAARRRRPAQTAILQLLAAEESVSRRDLLSRFSPAPLKQLLADDLVELFEREIVPEKPLLDTDPQVLSIILNREQEEALVAIGETLATRGFQALLLQGVTGSGKTQVYLEAIRKVVAAGKQALVLVPEISLTPQIAARFHAFFGDRVCLIHSRLSDRQRYDAWLGIRRDEYDVVVGARSAVFAPLSRPGLIVVDEEHDASFKQFDPAPRYHARDAALLRGSRLRVPVLLGTATPSLETHYNVEQGRYRHLQLPRRTGVQTRPQIELVDMKQVWRELTGDTVKMFSNRFLSGLMDTLERGEQAIILQNRRGFASWQQCLDCGTIVKCSNCDITLTYHKTDQALRCHYCGFARQPLERCPECDARRLEFFGTGTQQVEEQLRELFPRHPILRMDQDTTRRPDAYNAMVKAFNAGDYDILLGTQSVAKGHDFPRVTFVGVVNADTELSLPDFRAQERSFQLMTQVAGRGGRAQLPGRVVIQTFRPENSALAFVQADDMAGFLAEEAEARRQLNYPPFSRLALLTVKSSRQEECRRAAEGLRPQLQAALGKLQLLGPAPAPIQRIWREYRYHYIIKSARAGDPNGRKLRDAVRGALEYFNRRLRTDDTYLTVTIDPLSLM